MWDKRGASLLARYLRQMRVFGATGSVAFVAAVVAAGLGVAVAGVAAAGAAAAPAVTSAQQTHPRVRPGEGGHRTSFTLSFTVRQRLGHVGVLATDYRVQVSPFGPAGASCWPSQPVAVSSGSPGQVIRLSLHPSPPGWCRRRYTVTVFLQRGPYCPPPAAGQPPPPCPEFTTQELNTGQTHFTVR
jgi:hypothetical protein